MINTVSIRSPQSIKLKRDPLRRRDSELSPSVGVSPMINYRNQDFEGMANQKMLHVVKN